MKNKLTKKKKALIISLSVGLPVLIIAACILLVSVFGLNVRAKAGKPLNLPFVSLKNGDIGSIDTDILGTQTHDAKLFGILDIKLTIDVYDGTPPEVITRNVVVSMGTELRPEDFIAFAKDHSIISYEFVSMPSTNSSGTVSVRVVDSENNRTVVNADYKVTDKYSSELTVQLGTSHEELSAMAEGFDTDEIDLTKCGTVRCYGELDGATSVLVLDIVDTEAPAAQSVSQDILLGQSLGAMDFVRDIFDASEVTAEFTEAPNFEKLGKQDVAVILTDAYGNSSNITAKLNIHSMQSTVIIEAGTTYEELADTIKKLLGTDASLPRITYSFEPEHKLPGTYETELIGEYSTIPFEVIVEDNIPPKFILRKLTTLAGELPKVLDFVVECNDASGVKFEYKETPDVQKAGNFLITVVATDRAGNVTEASTVLKVIRHDIPPIIYGVRDITIYEGETVSYRSGIYAVDDKDGKMSVKVDASGVNTSVAGTYFVTYTATDSEGNTASTTASLTVKPITIGAVYELADEILSTIINDSMTDREKARAVYDWCRSNIKYSTVTSNLMGYYAKASYSGLTKRYGNCYTYYAVSGVLLSRAGISNIMIQRNSTTDPHYWNLVNIDGSWYHFDTCPQPSPHKLEVFLLTDSEVREFSRTSVANYYNFDKDNYPETP